MKNQTGGIKGVIIVIVTIIALTISWQLLSDRQKQASQEIEQILYTTPLGEVSVEFPSDWQIGENSFEDEGLYSLELKGPRNESITNQVKKKYSIDINDSESTDEEKFFEVLNSSISNDFALLAIDIASSSEFELDSNRKEWKDNFIKNNDTTSGASFSNFEEIEINGSKGYRFQGQVVEGEQKINTLMYMLLGPSAQIEITILPKRSNNITQAENIVNSIVINEIDQE